MFTYLVELWCDTPACDTHFTVSNNPTLYPLDEKALLTEQARAEGWAFIENMALCPGCALEKCPNGTRIINLP